VPWHLATKELAEELERVLVPGGLYALNLIDRGALRFARAEVATLRSVFDHVALVGDVDGGGNFVVLASQRPITPPRPQQDEELVTGEQLDRFAQDADVLTDAHAPVDQLLTPTR
jgi:cobyric acid synthase